MENEDRGDQDREARDLPEEGAFCGSRPGPRFPDAWERQMTRGWPKPATDD